MKHLDKRTNELVSLSFLSWSWGGWIGPAEYKNFGSTITHSSHVQICTAPRTVRQPVGFRYFEKTIEPQSHGFELDLSTMPKPVLDIQPFTIPFMASVDVANSFKLESSARGESYLSITKPNRLTCGLVLPGDPKGGRKPSIKLKLMRKDTCAPGSALRHRAGSHSAA